MDPQKIEDFRSSAFAYQFDEIVTELAGTGAGWKSPSTATNVKTALVTRTIVTLVEAKAAEIEAGTVLSMDALHGKAA